MIDLHCHLLDGTKCGPETFEESLEMCRLAVEDGVRTIVATPRWEADSDEPPLPLSECREKLETLRRKMQESGLTLKLGFLLKFRPDLDALLEQYNTAVTLGDGRCVLVALPALSVPESAAAVWNRLRQLGYSVLLARPECSPALRRDTTQQLLAKWIKQGLLLQLDAASVTGLHGREVQRFAHHCLREFPDAVVIASSAQRANPHASTLGQARELLSKKNGIRHVDRFVSKTPAALIASGLERETNNQPRPSRPRSISLFRGLKPQKPFTNPS